MIRKRLVSVALFACGAVVGMTAIAGNGSRFISRFDTTFAALDSLIFRTSVAADPPTVRLMDSDTVRQPPSLRNSMKLSPVILRPRSSKVTVRPVYNLQVRLIGDLQILSDSMMKQASQDTVLSSRLS